MNNIFTKNDFLIVLRGLKTKYPDFINKVFVSPEKNTNELVFVLQTSIPNFSIKIFSSIPYTSNTPREKGEDAIRVIPLFFNRPYTLIPKTSRVNRTINWNKSLENRVISIRNAVSIYICPKCNHLLLLRKNKTNTKFLGCSNYPNCKYTKSLS